MDGKRRRGGQSISDNADMVNVEEEITPTPPQVQQPDSSLIPSSGLRPSPGSLLSPGGAVKVGTPGKSRREARGGVGWEFDAQSKEAPSFIPGETAKASSVIQTGGG